MRLYTLASRAMYTIKRLCMICDSIAKTTLVLGVELRDCLKNVSRIDLHMEGRRTLYSEVVGTT